MMDEDCGDEVSRLLAIINDEAASTTEGQRESSVEVLRGLLKSNLDGKQQGKVTQDLQLLFEQCSNLFERRMSRHQDTADHRGFHGSSIEPLERSEHIRLSLVELMSDLATYLFGPNHLHKEENDATVTEAASRICQTLVHHTFAETFPDILMASCTLIQTLAKISPVAVERNATDLLLQLAGIDAKHCLFRNRRSKIRREAVKTSCAVALCCQLENTTSESEHNQSSCTYTSSSLQEEVLRSILLPGWEDLIKLDPSVSVRVAALDAAGMVAAQLNWLYYLRPNEESCHQTLETTTFVESHVMTLFVLGASDGNVETQTSAIQIMIDSLDCVRHDDDEVCGQASRVPWSVIGRYFQPVLEMTIASCSHSRSTCKGRVRSLEALQVLLSFAIAILDGNVFQEGICQMPLPMIQAVVDCLRKNIISEEQDILEAALKACSILGGSDTFSKLVLDALFTFGKESVELRENTLSLIASPMEATSTLLLLSRLVKGHTSNDDAARILQRFDPMLTISSAKWIYTSPLSMAAIVKVIPHCTGLNMRSLTFSEVDEDKGVEEYSMNPSLASALLDAVAEVTSCCRHHLDLGREEDGHEHDDSWTLKEEWVLEILMTLVRLLGCPTAYGLSSQARDILQDFSQCFLCEIDSSDSKQSLLDIHFRKLASQLTANSTFPWKETDASFISMCALLQACRGSTVSSNFDLVVPFFKPLMVQDDTEIDEDKGVEEYSMRISLMALLQTILSDESFHRSPQYASTGGGNSSTPNVSATMTTEIILSLVLPNLVWRPGGLAAALRRLSVATVFSLLRCSKDSEASAALDTPEMLTQLIPILQSCLDETEDSSRELACLCLSMILEQTHPETFKTIWETHEPVIDTLQSRLLGLLDDNHNPVRLAACKALECLLIKTSSTRERKQMEDVVSILTVHLADDEKEVQKQVGGVLAVICELQL